MRHNNDLELSNIDDLDESVLNAVGVNYDEYSYVDGEDGDEDSVEDEGEAAEVGGLTDEELPKFRQLVREEKLKFKAKYGKSRIKTEWVKNRFGIKYPKITRTKGWRHHWKNWKRSGGLAKLKQFAKGQIATRPTTPADVTPAAAPSTTSATRPPATVTQKAQLGEGTTTATPTSTQSADESVPEKSAQDDDNKILGMPKGLAIGLGIAILAIGGVVVYKKMIKK